MDQANRENPLGSITRSGPFGPACVGYAYDKRLIGLLRIAEKAVVELDLFP